MNTLISLSIPATSTTSIDFNLRSVKNNTIIVIASTQNLTVTLKNGVGNVDPSQTDTSAIPYVSGGTSYAVFDGTGTDYSVSANVNKSIVLIRDEIGEWLRADLDNDSTSTSATVTIYGNPG